MSDSDSLYDKVGDLVHHAYDAITGALSSPSAPKKAASTEVDASQHVAGGYTNAKTRLNQIDQQVKDDGG